MTKAITKVKVHTQEGTELPEYATEFSAGMDLRANVGPGATITLKPMSRVVIKTGLFLQLPPGMEGQVRPRSGLAANFGITVLNAPGTIDADYTGEVGVILINLSQTNFPIKHGDRIAQLVVAKHERVQWDEVQQLASTERGFGGFGSTGKR